MQVVSESQQQQPVKQRPHKSTTHKELFFQVHGGSLQFEMTLPDAILAVNVEGTVFFRQEAEGQWLGAASICHPADQFNRRLGRTWARRHYFQKQIAPLYGTGTREPTFDDAVQCLRSTWLFIYARDVHAEERREQVTESLRQFVTDSSE